MSAKFFQFKKNLFLAILLLVIFVLPNNALAENLLTVGSANSNLTGTDSAIFSNIGSISATTTSLIRLQKNGVDLFKVDSTGNVTMGNFLTSISAANVSSGAFGSLSGNGNYSFPGNVGIGTMTPAARLNIYSTSSIEEMFRLSDASGSSAANKYINWYSNNGGTTLTDFARIGAGYGSDYINSFMAFSVADGARVLRERVRIDVNGNVGIGTTNPTSALYVNATTAGDGGTNNGLGSALYIKQNTGWSGQQPWALYVANGGYTYLSGFRVEGPGGLRSLMAVDPTKSIGFATSGDQPITFTQSQATERMRIAAGGSVGIGTTTPDAKLNVNGNFHVSGAFSSVVFDKLADVSGSRIVMADSSGALYATSTSVATGLPSPSGIGQTLRSNGASWVANNLLYNNGTNVGVGTTAPGAKLHINDAVGNGPATSGSAAISGLRIGGVGYYPQAIDMGIQGNASPVYGWIQARLASNYATNYNLILNPNGGNVGVGTSNPSMPLSVEHSSGNSALSLKRAAPGGTTGIGFFNNDGFMGGIQNVGTKGLNFLDSTSVRVTLKDGGNVGIGTTTPNRRLDLGGGTDGRIYGLDTATNAVFADSEVVPKKWIVDNFAPAVGGASIWALNGNNAYNTNSGNVGIGLTNPNAKLQVKGGFVSNSIRSVRPEAEIAQGCTVSVSGGTLVGGGPTYRTQNSYWQITAAGQSLTLNCGGWWHTGLSFAGSNRYDLTGTRMPADFTIEKSTDGVTWTSVATVTGNTENYFNVNLGDAPRVRITVNAFQSGETQAVISALQLYEMDDFATPEPFGYTGAGNVVHMGNNIGIGLVNPGAKLDVVGAFRTTSATISLLGNSGDRIVMTDNSGNLYATSTSVATGLPSPSDISGYTLRSDGTSWVANNLLYNNGTNIGIGTAAPGAKLDVFGTNSAMVFRTVSPSGQIQFYNWSDGKNYIESTNANNTASQPLYFTGYGGGAGTFSFSGNVGIGTTAPNNNLEVRGASGLRISDPANIYRGILIFGNLNNGWNSGIRAYDSGDAEMRIWHANASGQIVLATGYNGETTTAMPTDGLFIDQNKVGIGYASPAAATGKLVVNGNVGIGTTKPSTVLHTKGYAEIDALGSATFFEGARARFMYGASPTSDAKVAFGSGWGTIDDFVIYTKTSGNFTTNSQRLTVKMDGNVGIGTTTPNQKLEVSGGNIFITDASINSGTPHAAITKTYLDSALETYGSKWILNGSKLYASSTDWNVGIGTTNPNYKLHIVNGGEYVSDRYGGVYGGTSGIWRFDSTNQNYGIMYTESNSDYISISPNGGGTSTPVMHISGSGNVGIALTNPEAKLDVVGSFRTTSATISLLGNSGDRIVMTDNSGNLYATSTLNSYWPKSGSWKPTSLSSATRLLGITSPDGGEFALAYSGGQIHPYTDGFFYQNEGAYRVLDTSDAVGFMSNRGTVAVASIDTATANGFYNVAESGHSEGLFTFTPGGSLGTFQMYAGYNGTLRWRNKTDSATWTSWKNIFHTGGVAVNNNYLAKITGGGQTLANSLIYDNGTNVGIGTTTPNRRLDLGGGTNGRIYGLDTATNAVFTDSEVVPKKWIVDNFAPAVGGASIWALNGNNAYNTNSGNVGIGTTSPFGKFQAYGNSVLGKISGYPFNSLWSWDSDHTGYYSGIGYQDISGSNKKLFAWWIDGTLETNINSVLNVATPGHTFDGVGPNSGRTIGIKLASSGNSYFNGGNVGISSTTPSGLLAIGNYFSISNLGTIYGPTTDRYLDLYGAQTNSIVVPKSILTSGGKLGVGTTAPGGKAEIAQNMSDYGTSFTEPHLKLKALNTVDNTGFVGITFDASTSANYGWSSGALRSTNGQSSFVWKYHNNSAAGTEYMRISQNGNVGIGTSAPNADYKLDVAGKINTSGGVAGGFCLSGDCIDSWGDVVGTFNSSTPLTIGNLTVSNIVMDQTGGFGNILNVRKLTVGTIDPLYRIDGTNYSSFAAAIVGGVKEEYLGRVKISQAKGKEYEYRLDFSKLSAPDELWVWRQTVDFSPENVEVNLTPYGAFARIYYIIEDEAIIFRADKPVTVSYRLSGKRVDWQNWPTTAKDQQEKPSFIINKGKVIK